MLVDNISNMLDKHHMITNGDGIVVAFSGGPDSTALLHALHCLSSKYDLKLFAVHLNHMLRGEEADRDEQFAERFSCSLGIPFFCERVSVEDYAASKGLSLEEAGRILRYDLFNRIREKTGATKIALAHNRNDQTETVIMRFLRGAGTSGLCGIKPVREGLYIRPLLTTSRQEIEEYCLSEGLAPVTDSTNELAIYTRNRVRLEVIPYIREHFNSKIDECITRNSELLREEDDFLNQVARNSMRELIRGEAYDGEAFNTLHLAVRRRMLRLMIEKSQGDLEGIENKHIEACIAFIEDLSTGKLLTLPKGLQCGIEYGRFSIVRKPNEINEDFCYELAIPGTTLVQGNVLVHTEIFELNKKNLIDKQFVKYFDYDKIKYGLYFRNRRDGDYIYPKGMTGSKKLKELFINKKIPKEVRDCIPLIASGSEILWILNLRDTRNYKVDDMTKHVLEISIEGGA